MLRHVAIILFVVSFSLSLKAGPIHKRFYYNTDSISKNELSWADSVLTSLTIEQRIAQLFMVEVRPNGNAKDIRKAYEWVRDYGVGGVVFFQGGPVRQINLTNYFQASARVPLLVGLDAEWGPSMRLDSIYGFPHQLMLGAFDNDELIYQMGRVIAQQCRRLGVHINFAPVVDINSNAQNPIINNRSFGENKLLVARKALAYMKGMQDNGLMAVAKHFPGHGDTDKDSHLTLPVINKSRESIDSLELYPFRVLINNGVSGIMNAHLNVPAIDTSKNGISSLSDKIVTSLLRKELGFKGLIFTDALSMKGIADYWPSGMAEARSLIAGNDILLTPSNVPKAIEEIKCEIERGNISKQLIDSICRKILIAKYRMGLNVNRFVSNQNVVNDLNTLEAQLLRRKIIEKSLTLAINKNNLIPFVRLDTLKMASLVIGADSSNTFQSYLNLYNEIPSFWVKRENIEKSADSIRNLLAPYNMVIIAVCNTDFRATKNYGVNQASISFIDSLALTKNVVLNIFATPYVMSRFKHVDQLKALLLSYEDNEVTRELSAQLLFGGISALGKLPVTASVLLPVNTGIKTHRTRLRYGSPEELGIAGEKFKRIDSIVNQAIKKHAMPGCQILVAKDTCVIYYKTFGYFTYDSTRAVQKNDIYDIASVTKIIAGVPSIMHLYENKKIDYHNRLSDYLPYLQKTNKKNIIISDILLHQARLKEWIPFYLNTIEPVDKGAKLFSTTRSELYPVKFSANQYIYKNVKLKDGYYSKQYSLGFPLHVADSLFIMASYRDSIFNAINSSELHKTKGVRYSDMGFIYFYDLAQRLSGQKFDNFLDSLIYKPIGASTTMYNPLRHFSPKRIAPTEDDEVFRKQVVQGYVHDPGAAMLGGVSGHAGIFSDANDLAKIMQMYMQYGSYGGIKYFEKTTLELFTSCYACKTGNRRGLGFDKPQMDYSKEGPTCKCLSALSFGHTGFTGTMVWADPETHLVFIFLSNRVYPDATENKLAELGVRTRIQEVISEAIK